MYTRCRKSILNSIWFTYPKCDTDEWKVSPVFIEERKSGRLKNCRSRDHRSPLDDVVLDIQFDRLRVTLCVSVLPNSDSNHDDGDVSLFSNDDGDGGGGSDMFFFLSICITSSRNARAFSDFFLFSQSHTYIGKNFLLFTMITFFSFSSQIVYHGKKDEQRYGSNII